MQSHKDPGPVGGKAVTAGEIFSPAQPAGHDAKAGRTEDLKALHADLTTAYREYLEMAKIKPAMLNPAMLGLIQQFLRHNEITAEAPQQAEMDALQRRLEQKRKARESDLARQNIVNLNQSQKA
jgi:hypothetical protein